MATIDQFLTSLRNEFGEQKAGKKFEVFCKWFLEKDPEWSKRIDKVWLWDDYPDKWQRKDLGTDLVFRDKEGLIWAVQAKCYSEHRKVIKAHVDSFIADSGKKQVDKRLWFQTTNKMGDNAIMTLTGQEKPVTVFSLRDFQAAQIDYPSSYAGLFQAKVKDKPRPDTHQVEAIEAVKSKLQSLDRGQMIMACGTGKTFTTLWIKEALNAQTTLVLLPSLSLLSQTMREWAWAGNTDFDILNVCSDKSVGKKTEDMDPSDTPFPVTSEVDEIARFIKTPNPKVIFCTYQSSPLIAEAQLDKSVPTFDLTIADEAHRCAGKADAGFATVLGSQKIRSAKRLFTTATPRYFGNAIKNEANAKDLAVVGMNDETVFGPVIHQLTFGEAISRELLTDYQVVIVGVDQPMVKQWIDNYEIVATNPDEHTDARTLAAKIGLIKAIKDYDLKRVISFHSRVKGAKNFSEELVDVVDLIDPIHRPEGLFLADYVSGEMNAGDRKDKIDRLKVLDGYDRGILTNARCLAEGVDVPSLDGVAFIDPRGSQVEIIQAVGRAIRKVRGADVQTKGTIVIPVFIEDGDDPEESIEASNFKPVWDVLKALRAHDEILADTLDQYRTNMAKVDSDRRQVISDKIIFDIPMSVDVEFSSALRTFLVEATTESWEFWFGLLETYKKENDGHVNVHSRYKTDDNFYLGKWISHQRTYYKKGNLNPERIRRLEEIGFIWDPTIALWEFYFGLLEVFKADFGHCRTESLYKVDEHTLGRWVNTQRAQYKKGELKQNRIQKLEGIEFVWDIDEYNWDQGFESLKLFHKDFLHCNIPILPSYTCPHTGIELGFWVSNRRKDYKKDKLLMGQIERLESLGFVWDMKDHDFEEGLKELIAHKVKTGSSHVASRHITDNGFPLGKWVSHRLTDYKKDKLKPERIQKLEAIGFLWDRYAAQNQGRWDRGFFKLVTYKKLNKGNVNVPLRHITNDGFPLGTFCNNKRQLYRTGGLSKEQIEQLEGIGFVWEPNVAKWEEGFTKLTAYKKENDGNVNVPVRYKTGDGFTLGKWVSHQRNHYKKNELDKDRIRRLEKLGFVWKVR